MEEWRAVPDLPQYEVSSEGRVRHVSKRLVKPLMGRRRRDYPRIQVWQGKGRPQRKVMLHVLVARAFIGSCPPGYEHNHKDGNKQNARPDNLEFVTHPENERHKFHTLGYRVNQGSDHGLAKLTETEVVAIHSKRVAGASLRTIASEFGVCVSTVSAIGAGKTWRHLHLPPVMPNGPSR